MNGTTFIRPWHVYLANQYNTRLDRLFKIRFFPFDHIWNTYLSVPLYMFNQTQTAFAFLLENANNYKIR